jgi:uncharacterized protein GlcG (DUF336 family)
MGAAGAEVARNGRAMSVAVVGEAGLLMDVVRMDGAPNAGVEVAHAKSDARTTGVTPVSPRPGWQGHHAVLGLPEILAVEGGFRLLHGDAVIRSIGVSGVQSARGGHLAAAGAALPAG